MVHLKWVRRTIEEMACPRNGIMHGMHQVSGKSDEQMPPKNLY
jgi:hypothetical protein